MVLAGPLKGLNVTTTNERTNERTNAKFSLMMRLLVRFRSLARIVQAAVRACSVVPLPLRFRIISFEGTLSVRYEPFEVGFVGLSPLVLPLPPFVRAVRLQRSCLITV